MLEEADRSLHDALCVIRCLVKKRSLIPGGGAPEAELSVKLTQFAQSLKGMDAYCFRLDSLFHPPINELLHNL